MYLKMAKTAGDIINRIKRLDTRLGVDIGAKKERAKLNKELEKLEKLKSVKNEDNINEKPNTA